MVYPITGSHYNDISLRKIIYLKPNKYDRPQAFRIDTISKPFDGKVTITAVHLSYDLSGYIVEPLESEATGIQDAISKINAKILNSQSFPFTFTTDITNTESKFNIQVPGSVRSILAGQEGSLLDVFNCEYKFDNYTVSLLRNRGENRGFSVRYGKNLTDIKQETKSDKLFTDIYPYYYRIVTETNTSVDKVYQQLYIRTAAAGEDPIEPFSADWLSLKEDGSPFVPIIKKTPIQIATEGTYYQKIYIWDDVVQQDGTTITKYVEVNSTDYPPNIPAPENTVTESTEMVTLTNKTIAITGRESIRPKRILPLDLTQYFGEKPTEQQLSDKANEYITNNKIGQIVETVEASFLRIDDPHINEALCLLGDTVKVYFDKIGVNSTLQVISTKYDAVADKYKDIGLGTKKSNFSDNALSIGDDVSSLNNDANYTNEIKVGEIIAKTITAEYIEGVNANFTKAQITTLATDELIASSIIQAAEASIDTLIAQLLVSEDAEIRNQLIVGDNIVVNGEINIKSGSISIVTDNNINNKVTAYINKAIDEDIQTRYNSQWLKSSYYGNTIITPDSTKIYKVFDIYNIWTQKYYKWDTTQSKYVEEYILPETCFEVDEEGNLTANSADIKGKITAIEGDIGGCIIVGVPNQYTQAYIIPNSTRYSAGWLTDTQGSTTPLTPQFGSKYKVTEDYKDYYYEWNGHNYFDTLVGVLQVGEASISSLSADKIIGGTISASSLLLQDYGGLSKFGIDEFGNAIATSLTIEGGSIKLGPKFVDVTNNDFYTPYSRDWLWIGQEKVQPIEGVYYRIENFKMDVWFGSSGNYEIYLANDLYSSNFIKGDDQNYYDNNAHSTFFQKRYEEDEYQTLVNELSLRLIKKGYTIYIDGWYNSPDYAYFKDGSTQYDLHDRHNIGSFGNYTTATSQINITIYGDYYPALRLQHLEINTNEYAYFVWDSTQNKYIEASPSESYFEVDEEGNVTAANVELSGQIIATSGNLTGIDVLGAETVYADNLCAKNLIINGLSTSFKLNCPIDLSGIIIDNTTQWTSIQVTRNILYTIFKSTSIVNGITYSDVYLRFYLENSDPDDIGTVDVRYIIYAIQYVQSGTEYTKWLWLASTVRIEASLGYINILLTSIEGNITGLTGTLWHSPTQATVINRSGYSNETLLIDCDEIVPSRNRTAYLGYIGNEWDYLYAKNAIVGKITISERNIAANTSYYCNITGFKEISSDDGIFKYLYIRDFNNETSMRVFTCATLITTLNSKGWNEFSLENDFNSSITNVVYVQYILYYDIDDRGQYSDRSYEPQVAWRNVSDSIYIYNDWTAGIKVSILVIGT